MYQFDGGMMVVASWFGGADEMKPIFYNKKRCNNMIFHFSHFYLPVNIYDAEDRVGYEPRQWTKTGTSLMISFLILARVNWKEGSYTFVMHLHREPPAVWRLLK